MQKKDITILVVNIQGLLVFNKDGVRANLTELEFHLASLQPHIVLLQETWLDASVESVSLVGYMVVSRRDRSADTNRGGVLTLARHDFNRWVHIENSGYDERSWHYLHIEPETVLLGNWYRAVATIHDGYVNLISEIEKHSTESTGIILSGDLNIHHTRWLRHSNGNSIQGADLKALCDNLGLQQLVGEPTRQQYLLALYLSDVSGTKIKVGPYIADHRLFVSSVPFPEVTTLHIKRERFNLQRARWTALKDALALIDWTPLHRGTAEDAATFLR